MIDGLTAPLERRIERRIERLERELHEARVKIVEQEAQILSLEVRVTQLAMGLCARVERYQ